jgi:putative ABC transport system permease protein
MIRHVIRLMWRRRHHNLLIGLEVFVSFLVLLGVMVFATQYASNYRYPLGYDIDRVWRVELQRNAGRESNEQAMETVRQLLLAVRRMPQIEVSAFAFTGPYENAEWGSGFSIKGQEHRFGVNSVTDTFGDVFTMKLVHGRFFDARDDGTAWKPVILNARLAHELFGDADPTGKAIRRDVSPQVSQMTPEQRAEEYREMRVVGVIDDFRQNGEFSTPQSYMLERANLTAATQNPPRLLLLRVRPGTTAQFEETLVRTLQGVAHDWSFDVQPVSKMRTDMLRVYLMPLIALGIIAIFLMIMVGLGLTGVLWQNVTQRTREIGLRRAKGASRRAVHGQIIGELLAVTTGGVLVGALLVVQAPILLLPPELQVPPGVLVASFVISTVVIYLLALACAWYPSRMATRVEPAEALRYE